MKTEEILCPRDYIVKHYMPWLERVKEGRWKIEHKIWQELFSADEAEICAFAEGRYITTHMAIELAAIIPEVNAFGWLDMQHSYQLSELGIKNED